MTVFLDGNSKQSRNHENYTLETNPRPINKTFAQEIEEKYFQIPSASNVPETKPSRRGSLRAFQVFMNNRLSVVYNIKMFVMLIKNTRTHEICSLRNYLNYFILVRLSPTQFWNGGDQMEEV